MSTKTTFKRIALVTVAALGFGLLGSVSANAAGPSTMSVTVTDLTLVDTNSSLYGFIPVNIYNAAGDAAAMVATESLTATVISWPTGIDSTTAASDLLFAATKRTHTAGVPTYTATSATGGTFSSDSGTVGSFSFQGGGTLAGITNVAAATNGNYIFAVQRAAGKAIDKGTYVIRIRLQDSSGFTTQQNVSVKFVSSAADTGAVITLASTGTFVAGESLSVTSTHKLTATLTSATGGRIFNTAALASGPGVPTLTAGLWAGTTPAIVGATTDYFVSDTGTQVTAVGNAGDFYSATASDSATALASYANGVYAIGVIGGKSLDVTNLSVTPYFRVTYGATAATKAITVQNGIGGTAGTPIFTGAGALTASTPFTLPLSTKTFSFVVSGATPGNAYSYSVAYTLVGSGDQSPLAATATTVYASSAGTITTPVTIANPIDGAKAVVTIIGFTTNPAVQSVSWAKSKATTLTADMDGATVALKSTTVFTATVTDAFGAPVAGVLLQPSLKATTGNGTATLVLSTVTTNAAGQATYSLTDAAAVAAGTDKVTWTAVDGSLTAASATITYAATAPAPTTLTAYYSSTPVASSNDDAIRTAVPTTGVYRTGTTKFSIQKARNNSVATTVVDTTGDQVRVVISAGVAGAKVTATASAGAYVLNAASFQASTVSAYTGETGYAASFVIGSNKTGANTVTFTSGTASTTVAFWVGNTADDARFVKLTQATAGGAVVASVTDRYGNGISGASVQISTSAGTLGNGQLTTVYTTTTDGTVSVLPVGADSAVITAIATSTSAEHAALAGYAAAGTAIDATVAAGNSTATLTVTPAVTSADSGAVAAQAASDAAAEATDAANAATDAANAAAEAADAATAAAQDAADAVAALSAQVATLISGLKAQLTALTNLVIKIQKKVKA